MLPGHYKKHIRLYSYKISPYRPRKLCVLTLLDANTSSGVPSSTIKPSAIKITRSEISLANAISWVTITMAICRSARDLITLSTSPVSSGSSAEVGSSKKRIFGFRASALAIATRWHCPPESWQG